LDVDTSVFVSRREGSKDTGIQCAIVCADCFASLRGDILLPGFTKYLEAWNGKDGSEVIESLQEIREAKRTFSDWIRERFPQKETLTF